jgi:hypothetical protein
VSAKDRGTAVSRPPRAQPQQSAGMRAQSESIAHSLAVVAQVHERQPVASSAKPSAQVAAQVNAVHATVQVLFTQAARTFAGQLGIGQATAPHETTAGSSAGSANVGQAQQVAAASAQSVSAEHSGEAPLPEPLPVPNWSAAPR